MTAANKPPIVPYPPMLPHLHKLLESGELLELWQAETEWKGVSFDYQPPRVDRLCADTENWRVMLHCVHPSEAYASPWHTHPWPAAVKLLGSHDGQRVSDCKLDHGVGFLGRCGLRCASRSLLHAGDCYEITDPLAWHYVRAVNVPAYSVMLVGHPFVRHAQIKSAPQRELTPEETEDMRRVFGDLIAWSSQR